MPKFFYQGKNASGERVEGLIFAADIHNARSLLRAQKMVLTSIAEKNETFADRFRAMFAPKIQPKDLSLFTRQLATLIGAGVPLVKGLQVLEEQITNPPFKRVVTNLRLDIEAGIGIAEAMKKYPQAFEGFYVSMVAAGELGGVLETILNRLAEYLEASEELRAKVKSALMYPAVVLSIAFFVTWFLLVFIIPRFEEMFTSFGQELPLATRILLNLSRGLTAYWYVYLPVPFIGAFVFKRLMKNPNFVRKRDGFLLRLPLFGILLKKVAIAKFSRTFSTLLRAGVPVLQAMDTVAKTAGNMVVEDAVLNAKTAIRQGERISKPLAQAKIFPPMVLSMISIGEEVGNLDFMLSKIADFYDAEVNTATEGLTSLIEPLVIVFMGLVIGSIVVAMFLPMFSMAGAVG